MEVFRNFEVLLGQTLNYFEENYIIMGNAMYL
jgi:hypothetical protein